MSIKQIESFIKNHIKNGDVVKKGKIADEIKRSIYRVTYQYPGIKAEAYFIVGKKRYEYLIDLPIQDWEGDIEIELTVGGRVHKKKFKIKI